MHKQSTIYNPTFILALNIEASTDHYETLKDILARQNIQERICGLIIYNYHTSMHKLANISKLAKQYNIPIIAEKRNFNSHVQSYIDGIYIEDYNQDIRQLKAQIELPIIGIGSLKNKHSTMLAAENGADFLFFGTLYQSDQPRRDLELASWASELIQTTTILKMPIIYCENIIKSALYTKSDILCIEVDKETTISYINNMLAINDSFSMNDTK